MKTTIAYERKYISITRKELYFTCLNEKKSDKFRPHDKKKTINNRKLYLVKKNFIFFNIHFMWYICEKI